MSSLGQLDRKTVVVNSTFRDMGSPSSFSWRFSERVDGVRYADLRMFTVENGLYNVDSTNNTFYLSENRLNPLPPLIPSWQFPIMAVTIPVGYYDDVTFASVVSLSMSAISQATNIYLVQILNSGILRISCAIGSTTSDGSFAIGFTDGTNPPNPELCAQLLGFSNYNTVEAYSTLTSGLYQTIQGDVPTALVIYDYLLVNSQKLGNDVSFYSGRYNNPADIGTDKRLPPSSSSCWAVVPNNQPSRDNNVLIWENVRPPQISTLKYPFSLDYIDINILDKFGQVVDLSGQSVSLVIELYTDKKGQDIKTHHN